MKRKLFLALTISINFFIFSCKKDDQSKPIVNLSTLTSVSSSYATTSTINVKTQGAKGDGVTDDTEAIKRSLLFAKANNVPAIYFPDGTYLVKGYGNMSGVIALVNGVGMIGNGPATCHIRLSTGRYNPTSIFYQALWNDPSISNIVIQGIDFDGQLSGQRFDASYQFGHGLSINNGQNIEVKNCKFQGFRGDGVLFGDTFESYVNQRITYNVNVHDSEFFNIYREGAMFCCTNGGSFYNNYVHGNGYLVGGVDIERHSVNETVTNISVYNNTFNFSDGYGPVERGGPIVKYRRAVTMGFFYKGYTNAVADSRSGSHKIYNNTITQGQIDCWGHTNVSISNNTFNNYYENIAGVSRVTTPSIQISDPFNTQNLVNVTADNNKITSKMQGNGISFKHYTSVTANTNTIAGTQLDGISILNTTGTFDSNVISNVGVTSRKASGIVINGNTYASLVVSNNKVTDTRYGSSRTVNCAVQVQNWNNGSVAPKILYNSGTNLIIGVVQQYYYQSNFCVITGNIEY